MRTHPSRREFLRLTAGTAVAAATLSSGILRQAQAAATAKVVLIRHAEAVGAQGKLNGAVIQAMLDEAVASLLRTDNAADAWRTYYRSFRLYDNGGRSFTLASDAVQNNRHYTRYVGGMADGKGQAAIHQGRWKLIANVVRKWARTLTTRVKERIREAFAMNGIGL